METRRDTSDERFAVIYRKLKETVSDAGADVPYEGLELSELREIDELRRFAMEVSNPDPTFHTGT
jgi:hypothetical protein